MATTDGTLALGSGAEAPVRPMGVFARPGERMQVRTSTHDPEGADPHA